MRVAFVGDPVRFGAWAMSEPAAGLTPLLVAPHDRAALEAFTPDAVVVLDVDAAEPAVHAGLGARVLGVAVAPPEGLAEAPEGPGARTASQRLARAAGAVARRAVAGTPAPSAGGWDRLVAIDPAAARGRELWRVIAPPVDDRLFRAPRGADGRPRLLCAQASTEHRETLLTPSKHVYDLRHIAHGITPRTIEGMLGDVDVAVVLAPRPGGRFEHAVALHLAFGHLVITDALTPAHGLVPGTDVLAAGDPHALLEAVGSALDHPGDHAAVRAHGHATAEQRFRASAVWPPLVRDLLDA